MLLKIAGEEHKKDVKDVIKYCFNGFSQERIDWIWEKVLKHGNCIAALENEKTAGCAAIYPYRILFSNQWVGMGGVGLVSTLPEFRNKRFAKKMMVLALEIMRDREQYFSTLGAFSIDFYRKLGWEICFEMKHYVLQMENLKGVGNGKGIYRLLTPNDENMVKTVYEQFSSKYTGTANGKDRHWYRRPPATLNSLIRYGLFDENDKLQGYIYFTLENRQIFVKELAYDSINSKKELLQFIYRHRAQASEVEWIAPPDDNTFKIIENPKNSLNQTITGKMLRIVDVQRVLELMTFDKTYKEYFTIKVDDPILPWNHHTFAVSVINGKADVKISEDGSADLECTIQSFAQISMGYISIGEAIELGKITVKNKKAAEHSLKLFPKKATYINEQF